MFKIGSSRNAADVRLYTAQRERETRVRAMYLLHLFPFFYGGLTVYDDDGQGKHIILLIQEWIKRTKHRTTTTTTPSLYLFFFSWLSKVEENRYHLCNPLVVVGRNSRQVVDNLWRGKKKKSDVRNRNGGISEARWPPRWSASGW